MTESKRGRVRKNAASFLVHKPDYTLPVSQPRMSMAWTTRSIATM